MNASPELFGILAGHLAQALERVYGRHANFSSLAVECVVGFDAQRQQLAQTPTAGALSALKEMIDTTAERLKAKKYDPAILSIADVLFVAGEVAILAANPEAVETDTWACDPIDPAATADR